MSNKEETELIIHKEETELITHLNLYITGWKRGYKSGPVQVLEGVTLNSVDTGNVVATAPKIIFNMPKISEVKSDG